MHTNTPYRSLSKTIQTIPNRSIKGLAQAMLFMLPLLFISSNTLLGQDGLKDLASPKKVYVGNLISNDHLDNPEIFRNGLANNHL